MGWCGGGGGGGQLYFLCYLEYTVGSLSVLYMYMYMYMYYVHLPPTAVFTTHKLQGKHDERVGFGWD